MESFFERNPGLRSRVPFRVDFPDYSVEEMVKIAELEASKRGFTIKNDALEKIASICSTAGRCAETGNGRFCRNLVEDAILGYALRVFGGDAPVDPDFTLAVEDLTFSKSIYETKKSSRIGFTA